MIDFGLDAYDDLQAAQEAGIDVPVFRPGTDEVMFTIRVHGPDSAQQRRAVERGQEESAARGEQLPLTRDEITAQSCLFLARCCSGWTHPSVSFTEEAAAEMFRRYGAIRQAVDAAAAARSRFIRRSPTASAAPSATV
ncbi:hypothetical protein [Methylobacterium sp. JK268]